MNENNLKMVISDLDGTLLDDNQNYTDKTIRTLNALGNIGVCRVIATGRSYFSVKRVLPPDFPIDFLIFSTGAGIMNWKTKKIFSQNSISPPTVQHISELLLSLNVDFVIHDEIPDNHKFAYHFTGRHNPDFHRRIQVYEGFGRKLDVKRLQQSACQIIAMLPTQEELVGKIRKKLPMQKVIRTTSPLNGQTIWVEIFPNNVSKGHSVELLCEREKILRSQTIAIGNDYNDLDMLLWTHKSYVVENAPVDLKAKFYVGSNNNSDGFASIIAKEFKMFYKN